MPKIIDSVRKAILYVSALVLVAGYPMTAMAISEEPTTGSETPTEQKSDTSKPEDQTQSTEDSTTSSQTPVKKDEKKKGPVYTFDPVTKKWNSDKWWFNPETGRYEHPPKPKVITPESAEGESNISNQGPDSSNKIDQDDENSTKKSSDTTVGIDNDILSDALSGDATVAGNTKAGSAKSGDAAAVANIVNSVNSSVTAGKNQKVATFTKDVVGDVKGDIVLYPLLLKAMLEKEAKQADSTKIKDKTNFDVNNNVDVNASSGDATVKNNTKAGDATTGNATAMANVVNILNSMIATQDSFIGNINIYGSLEGDILIAPDFIPQMLASNGGASHDNKDSSTKLSSQDTTTIVNNISAVAKSGAASVLNNTSGGDAKTGDADSNVVIFNVTGRDIVAENSMLVFVNVLGKWVGMIVDAPAGTTAAMIGNGVKSNQKYAPDLTVEAKSQHGITNTIAVNADTGDATVAGNTMAGNATSGNARAFANVANVSNSSLSLSGWFGLLFINITGNWYGSFALNTGYGNQPASNHSPKPVEFVPQENKPVSTSKLNTRRVVIDSRYLGNSASLASAELSNHSESSAPSSEPADVLGESDSNTVVNDEPINKIFLAVIGSIVLLGSSVLGVRRFLL